MLKIRLQGTPDDIIWFQELLEKQNQVKVIEFSRLFRNYGTNRFYRTYIEVEKNKEDTAYVQSNRNS